ncbi:MAG: EutN/CcmL family microcompartment protein [bacterium]
MVLGRVAGTVVSTNKEARLEGIRFLLVEKLDPRTMDGTKSYVVAMDAVGAGIGEVVFYVSGSSSRLTEVTEGKPADATITAIVDSVELDGTTVFRKE